MKKHTPHLPSASAAALHERIGVIPDFPRKGILFRDVSPLLRDGLAFAEVIDALCMPYLYDMKLPKIDHIIGIESRGFIFAAAVATGLRRGGQAVGFVPVRKPGKLPGATRKVSYELEYGEAALEIQHGALQPGANVVIMDDLLATGGTAAAAAQLVVGQGARVVSFDFVIELVELGGRARLQQHMTSDVPAFHALFTY